jgi:YtkA-like
MRLLIPLLGLLLAFLAGAAPALAADCPLDLGRGTGWVVFSDHYMIAFRPDPMRIEIGEPFALLFNVCTKNGNPAELVAVEALMPDEKRSMTAKPAIVSAGDGRYRAEGMVFDKSGRWEIAIDVRAGEESERLTHEIILK